MRKLISINFRYLVNGLALFAAILIIMCIMAPYGLYRHDKQVGINAVVLNKLGFVSQNSKVVYLSISSEDLSEELLQKLYKAYPHMQFKPIDQRSSANDECGLRPDGTYTMGACKEDNFLEVRPDSVFLWHTLMVSWNTAACGGRLILFKGLAHWYVVSDRWRCTDGSGSWLNGINGVHGIPINVDHWRIDGRSG